MEQQLAQLFRRIEAAADIVQMHGEGKDEAYLCQLGRLEGEAAQFVPGIVVGVARVVADGQRADGHIADDRCARLHHGPAVVADAGELAGELIHGKAAALLRRP